MLEVEVNLMRHNGRYLERLLAGVPEDRLNHQPAPGLNTPLWILGHLTVCNDYPPNLLGHEKVCPQAWHDTFGPFSYPHDVPADAPTVAELLPKFYEGLEHCARVVPAATAQELAQANPIAFLPQFATIGELIAHCLTNHAATHLGQFSAWRRMLGMPSV